MLLILLFLYCVKTLSPNECAEFSPDAGQCWVPCNPEQDNVLK